MDHPLAALGWTDWHSAHAPDGATGEAPARVTAVDRGRYVVRDADGESPAALAGRMLHRATSPADLPCVGDWVAARRADGTIRIHGVLPRRTFLRRKVPGNDIDVQMIAANVDLALVIQSCQFDFNVRRLERYLATVHEGSVESVVLLTKTDLVSESELAGLLAAARRADAATPVIPLSNLTGAGLDDVRALLTPGRTVCLLGSSGVGKSTLINRLVDGTGSGVPTLPTLEVSRTGEGRHTTRRRQLFVLDGGALVVDTPGMRELGLLDAADGLDDTFSDVAELARRCRFADCRHGSEPGCAVRAAVEQGDLDDARFRSYVKLRREESFHTMSYVERRRKDREFSRQTRAVASRVRRDPRDRRDTR